MNRNNTYMDAREGQSLSDGNAAVTGEKSNIYLNLNSRSTLKMDETTRVEIDKVSARALSLTLVSGAVSADITRDGEDDTYEIRAGRSTLGVRGTSFIVEFRDDAPVFIMLEGSGDVDGITLTEGNVAVIEAEQVVVIAIADYGMLSDFARNEMNERGIEPPAPTSASYTIDGDTVTLRNGSITFTNISDSTVSMIRRLSGNFMRAAFDRDGSAHYASLQTNSVSTLQEGWHITLTVQDGEEAVFSVPAGSIGTALTVTHSYVPVFHFITVSAGETISFTNISEHGQYINVESGSYASATYIVGSEPREPRGRTTIRTFLTPNQRLVATPADGVDSVVFYIPTAHLGTFVVID
jgi:hypothetical protein